MKNQYFGDIRDLFKYDLISVCISEIDSLKRFTFIPLLTKPDGRTDGLKTDYTKAKAGFKNEELEAYLKSSIGAGRRDIREIISYFESIGTKIAIYKGNQIFSHKSRQEYFDEISDEYLQNALIFLDPDNGMEVKNSNHRHVLFREIKDIYNRMDNSSLLMIYQHFPHENHVEYIQRRNNELFEKIGALPALIHDGEIIFFFITKTKPQMKAIEGALMTYGIEYPQLRLV